MQNFIVKWWFREVLKNPGTLCPPLNLSGPWGPWQIGLKVVFHPRWSSIEGRFPSIVILYQWSSSELAGLVSNTLLLVVDEPKCYSYSSFLLFFQTALNFVTNHAPSPAFRIQSEQPCISKCGIPSLFDIFYWKVNKVEAANTVKAYNYEKLESWPSYKVSSY